MGARVLILIAALCACERRSSKYCELHPTDLAFCDRSDAAVDAPTSCTTNTECAAADPFCEPASHICVECLTNTDCASKPGTPICDPARFACVGCLVHADCPSDACLPDGTCGDDSNVIYVAEGGIDTNPCTHDKPCKLIAHAITLLTTMRPYIRLSGSLVESVTIASKRATFLADPTTTLTGVADPTMKLQMSEIRIFDLTVAGTAAAGGIKSEMSSTTTLTRVTIRSGGKKGLEAKGGYLRVNRCTIAQNVGGGIVLDANADFSITNSFIYLNGAPNAAAGGVSIGASTMGNNQFEFNTVADNAAMAAGGGVRCPTTNSMSAPNNLIVANTPDNTIGCDFASSLLGADVAPFAFVGGNNYHIGATSTARDTVTATSTIREDFDGQFRPLGTAKDFGADEYKP